MKNMKKLLAVLVAVLMIAASMSALAAAGDLAKDTSVTITGLDDGDTVDMYQVLKWVDSAGWALCPGFESLSSNTNIAKLIDPANKDDVELTKADVEAITTAAKAAKNAVPQPTGFVHTNDTLSGTTTFTKDVDVGMWLALVTPADVNTIYNPIIVSADYTVGGTNTIDSSAKLGTSTVAKKDTTFVKKETPDITLEVGKIVTFTVTTVIPAYADSYVNPTFELSDSLSQGLEFVVDTEHPFTVSSGDVTYTGAPSTGAKSFTLKFDSAKIAALVEPQNVTVTYSAKLTSSAPWNIDEQNNDVTVKFSNNPGDDDSHSHLKDEVIVYTFDVDSKIKGMESYITGEIVKVGVDKDGKAVLESVMLSNQSLHPALAGAEFGIYRNQTDAENENEAGLYKNTVFTTGKVTSTASGLLPIQGLDEGTYYIKELKAPDGFIRDTTVHYFTINATKDSKHVKETLEDGCEVEYDVPIVTGYTVTFDGGNESSYTWTNDGPFTSDITPYDSSSEIKNTKGVELPSTGGMGTTLFYIGGAVLVLGAVVVMITRRRVRG